MKALYRKYRPKTLSEVVGEQQVTNILSKAIDTGKISHAYLFIGPRGCGKTSVARIFAHEINKFKYELEDNYVDIIEIDAASNTGVENIRELREKATIAPTKGKYKIYIIDEVHMLSKSAFNALLKTLEEPPKHVVFIMATTDAYKVPVTITSRSQTFTFKLADQKTMFDFLKTICNKEKINIEDDALQIIVKRGGGSFRDSLSLLDQISTISDAKITKSSVIEMLGLPENEIITSILDSYISRDIVKITTDLKDLLNTGIKPETIAEEMINQIISEPKIELLSLLEKLPEIKPPFAEAKILVALLGQNTQTRPSLSPQPRPIITKTVSQTVEIKESTLPSTPKTETTTTKTKVIETQPAPVITAPIQQDGPFSWEAFLERVQSLNDAIYAQLLKTTYALNGNTLNIYPSKKIIKTILSRDNNKAILINAGNGVKIEIHEVGDAPNNQPEDKLISKISDIMGGAEEVKQDGGKVPF